MVTATPNDEHKTLRHLITAKELSERTSLPLRTVYHLASRKKDSMPHYRFTPGGRVLFDFDEVLEWSKGKTR